MLVRLQNSIAVCAHVTVVCTFGLALALGTAGLMHAPVPLGAGAKFQATAAAPALPRAT